jgi:uncharacterized membrane protein YdjX (TVP38/TMEM64 family)
MRIFLYRYRRLISVTVFLALLWLVFQVSGLHKQLSLTTIQDQLLGHPRISFIIFVLLFSLGNLVQIPGGVFLAAAVLVWGQWIGGVATLAAANVSCLVTFLLVRCLSGNALEQINNPRITKILHPLATHPVRCVLFARIVFQTFPALNYALAMSNIKLGHYALGTLLGLPLPIALFCIFFDFLLKAVFHI